MEQEAGVGRVFTTRIGEEVGKERVCRKKEQGRHRINIGNRQINGIV